MSNPKETESEAFGEWFSSQRTYSSLSAMERALNITKGYLHLIKDGARRAVDPELRRKLQDATGLKAFDPIANISESSRSAMASEKETSRETITSKMQKEMELPEDLSAQLESAIKKLGLTLSRCSERYKIKLGALKKYKSGVRKPASEANIAAVLNILSDARAVNSELGPSAEFKIHDQLTNTRTLIREVKELKERVDQIDTKLTDARMYLEMAKKPSSTDAEGRARKTLRLLMSLSSELEFFKTCTEDERRIFKKTVPGQDVGYITTLLRALYDEDRFQKWLFFSTYKMKGKENGE